MKLLKLLTILLATSAFATTTFAQVSGDPEKIAGWVFAYQHDANGGDVAGNKNRLEKALAAGADFRIDVDGEVLFNCTRVTRSSSTPTQFGCAYETLNILGQTTPLLSYGDLRTDGTAQLNRTNLYTGANEGETTTMAGARWYVRVR